MYFLLIKSGLLSWLWFFHLAVKGSSNEMHRCPRGHHDSVMLDFMVNISLKLSTVMYVCKTQVITWEVEEGRSQVWDDARLHWAVLPGEENTALVMWWFPGLSGVVDGNRSTCLHSSECSEFQNHLPEVYQMFMEGLTPILLTLFQTTEREGMPLNSACQTSITLIPKTDNMIKNNFSDVHWCKNSQQNSCTMNSRTHLRDAKYI